MGVWTRFALWNHTPARVDLLSSPWFSPRVLVFFRILFAAWQLSVCIWIGVVRWNSLDNGLVMGATLSYISYCCISLYFLLAIYFTYKNRILYKQAASYAYGLMEREPLNYGQRCMWVLFEVLCPVAFLVTIVYWSVLYHGGTSDLTWHNLHLHASNSLVMLLELFMSRQYLRGSHVFFLLLFGGAFVGWLFLVHHLTGTWIYEKLDIDNPNAKYYYSAFGGGSVVLYALVYLLCKLRDACGEKCGPVNYQRGSIDYDNANGVPLVSHPPAHGALHGLRRISSH